MLPSLATLRAKTLVGTRVLTHPGVHWQIQKALHCSHTARSRARLAAGCFPSHYLHQLKIIIFNPNRKWFAHTTTASMRGRAFLLERSSTTRFKIQIEEKIRCITTGANICVKRKQKMKLLNEKICHLCKRGYAQYMVLLFIHSKWVCSFPVCVLCFCASGHYTVRNWKQKLWSKLCKWPFERQPRPH